MIIGLILIIGVFAYIIWVNFSSKKYYAKKMLNRIKEEIEPQVSKYYCPKGYDEKLINDFCKDFLEYSTAGKGTKDHENYYVHNVKRYYMTLNLLNSYLSSEEVRKIAPYEKELIFRDEVTGYFDEETNRVEPVKEKISENRVLNYKGNEIEVSHLHTFKGEDVFFHCHSWFVAAYSSLFGATSKYGVYSPVEEFRIRDYFEELKK